MHIIGNVIKQAIDLRNQFVSENDNAAELQHKQLKNLLDTAKNTAFGKYYGFDQMLDSDDMVSAFQKAVPLFDYDKIFNEWWKQSLELKDITWPGRPKYFARSSGTTGKEPKRIPVTDDMVNSIRKVGISQLTGISKFELPPEFFEKQILMLGSSTNLAQVDEHEEGEISGISASNIPTWFGGIYKPGPEIASIPDWDERVQRIAEEAPNWDIGAVSGIPSWILLMFRKIIEVNKLNNIHEIWPALSVYTPGGVAFEPFKPSFDEVFGKEVIYMDTYLASEGFFAYNNRPETSSMKLALEHGIFFEFIPFDDRGFDENGNLLENPQVHTIAHVDTQTNYAMLVSTVAGTWRYMIGDTVQFTDLDEYEIKITGRTKYFLNVVGSQLSENKMNDAIKELEESVGLAVEEYSIACVRDEKGDYYHEWIIGTEDGSGNAQKAGTLIDDYLKESNKNYGVARSKALDGVKAYIVSSHKFHNWHAQKKKKGGQVKTQKVMKEEDFLKFKDFVLNS